MTFVLLASNLHFTFPFVSSLRRYKQAAYPYDDASQNPVSCTFAKLIINKCRSILNSAKFGSSRINLLHLFYKWVGKCSSQPRSSFHKSCMIHLAINVHGYIKATRSYILASNFSTERFVDRTSVML